MTRRITPLLYLLIALGSIAGLYGAWKRYEVEGYNKRVELALEYSEVKTLADMTRTPVTEALHRFARAGITSVAVTEETLGGLESHGELRSSADATGVTVYTSGAGVLARVRQALQLKGLRIGPEPGYTGPITRFVAAPQTSGTPGAGTGFVVAAEYTTLRALGVGLDDRVLAIIRSVSESGVALQPVGRIANYPGVSPETMQGVFGALKAEGIQTVIFVGNDVLGFRGLEKEAAVALKASGLNYGQIEFGKQKGDEALGFALHGEYIRVHSIGEAELGTLDENEAIDRFVRGARERNIRLCYIRLPFTAGADPVSDNAKFLEKIQRGIARGREMTFGVAHVYGETNVPRWVFALVALGAAAGLTLLLLNLAAFPHSKALFLLCVTAALCVVLAAAEGETGRKLVALLSALVFPTIACLRRDILGGAVAAPGSVRGSMVFAVKGIAVASAITALGIVQVIGLLATRPFMLKANQFLGIKAAHAIPLVLIGLLVIFGLPRLDRPWAEEWAALRSRANRLFDEPTRVGQILFSIAALAVLMLIVARTGNEPGVGVSGVELKFRSLLDRLLPVRPRTKEFLLGHPAFFLALAFWFRGRRAWALPLFVVGVIGQVSILNTFCHIHTPMSLSLIRDVTGLVAGTAIGACLFLLAERILPAPGTRAVSTATMSAASPNGNGNVPVDGVTVDAALDARQLKKKIED